MNRQLFLDYKVLSYTNALLLPDKTRSAFGKKASAQNAVIFLRLQARDAANELASACGAARYADRTIKQAKLRGITASIFGKKLMLLEQNIKKKRAYLAQTGETLCLALGLWKDRGATLRDLCNLCNRDYDQVVEEIGREHINDDFGSLLFIYNLDFKSDRDFIDYDVDAPLTHAVKEYMLEQILGTEEGRRVSREAFAECFPEVWDNRLNAYTDEDGIQHLVDKDGVEVESIKYDSDDE